MTSGFLAGFLLIGLAELGDKTFFISAILSMRHSRRWVFLGAMAALTTMTLMAVLAGQIVSMLPQSIIYYGEIIVFAGFGLKLLYEAWKMTSKDVEAEVKEAEEAVNAAEAQLAQRKTPWAIMREAFGLVLVGEWGDRTQITTVMLAATYPPVGVVAGAISGHGISIALAVIGGRLLAGRISERLVLAIAGTLFLMFAVAAALRPR
ncbi:TMEM165/GDT1 family protein [Synechococcales cyanobacterium C]|uniref:GDT1 family protein n=1 Tax=Petrachloros mirabilis ULC683 TaxID=2781853 RepID=A0A8K1ZX28_9CYAN|nr:TMEM165/GDT1 family protein [Petrachloros mirabilis]NCJ05257.1 TMEM165/GDT1 family protein [Petrachloros mirabilis ULC683]